MKAIQKDDVICVGLAVLGAAVALNWIRDFATTPKNEPPAVTAAEIAEIKRGMVALHDANKAFSDSLLSFGELMKSLQQELLEEVNERRRTELERTIPLALKATIHARIDDIRARYDAGHLSLWEVAQEYEEIAKDMRSYKRD